MLCGEPLDRCAIDFIGPLPRTERGNEHLLVITDYFTKYTEAYPLPNQTAETTAEALAINFFTRFGAPRILHSDMGPNFESRLFQHMRELFEIDKTRTTAYRPNSDGQTERFNRSIQQMLKAYVDDDRTDWDVHIPYLLMAYRSTVQESTGFTPNKLMFGREINLPTYLVYGPPSSNFKPKCYTEYVNWFSSATSFAFNVARENLKKSALRQKRNYDVTVKRLVFDVDDLVWFFYPPKTGKLRSGWIGPYKVLQCLQNHVYLIQHLESGNTRKSHVDNLRAFETEDLNDVPITHTKMPSTDTDSNVIALESNDSPVIETTKSGRVRRRPAYLDEYVA